ATAYGSGLTTLTVNPQNIGDLEVVSVAWSSTTQDVTSMAGGGVTTWTKAGQYDGGNQARDLEIWYGVVTSTGPSTITFNWSGSITGHNAEYSAQEFTAGTGVTWSLATTGHLEDASSTNVAFPSLTP